MIADSTSCRRTGVMLVMLAALGGLAGCGSGTKTPVTPPVQQVRSISGTLTNLSAQPVPNAAVTVTETSNPATVYGTTTTAADGTFSVPDVPADVTVTVTFTVAGSTPFVQIVTPAEASTGLSPQANFVVQPPSPPPGF
jgi:hypothetical protein